MINKNFPYDIEFAMSAKLSAVTVEEMIRNVIEAQTGKKVVKVNFKTRDIAGFDGCTVIFAA
jgi:hypothetical protein